MQTKISKIIPTLALLTISAIAPVQAAVDNCMVGRWKPDQNQLKQQFSQASKQMISKISGQVVLILNKNGSGIYQLNNFTMSMNGVAGGPPMTMTLVMNGSSRFNWSAANRQFSMRNEAVSIKTSGSMNMGGMKMPIPSIPISDKQASSGVADGGYTCSGNTLVFRPKTKGTVLQTWHKI